MSGIIEPLHFGPIACHMEEVAKELSCDYISARCYEVSDCFAAFEEATEEAAARTLKSVLLM